MNPGHDGHVRKVVAGALYARLIPANRLHLFEGITPEPGIFEAVEKLAAIDGEIIGSLSGKWAFKTARSVTSLMGAEIATRLDQGAVAVKAGAVDQQLNGRVLSSLKMARLLLSIDRKRNWLPQLTLERWIHALRQLNSVCSADSKVLTIGPDLLADIRTWLQAKPAKPTSQKEENEQQP